MQVADLNLVAIRAVTPEDRNFIFSTFLKGLYYGDSWFSLIHKDIFMKHYHHIIERLLVHPAVTVYVACLKEAPDVILGYSITRKAEDGSTILDWVFVKKAWRKIGIAKTLVPSNTSAVTHLTQLGKSLLPPGVIFNPFT